MAVRPALCHPFRSTTDPRSRLRAVGRVVGVPEAVRSELRAGIRNMRIHVHLGPTIEETPGNLAAPLRVYATRVVRREGGTAGATVVVPHLDVLEQRHVLLGHDRVEQRRSGNSD